MFYELVVLTIASSYVFAIYAFQPIGLRLKSRDDLKVINYRFKRVSILCLILFLVVPLIVGDTFQNNVRQIGLIPGYTNTFSLLTDISNIWYSIIFVCVLFSSSIFQLLEGGASHQLEETPFLIRDCLFAPITEELIYRGFVSSVVVKECPSFLKTTPYLFGFAHIHHGWQLYRKNIAWQQVLLTTAFQFTYTSLFGYLSNWIYFKTLNLWCPIILHMGCNYFGFPTFRIDSKNKVVQFIYYILILLGVCYACNEFISKE